MLHWFLLLVFFFFSFLISLISYLLLFLKSDRSLVLNCCSDLTPTQAIKSGEATVGTWTTSRSIGTRISFHISFIPSFLFVFSHNLATITRFLWFSLEHSHLSISAIPSPFCHVQCFTLRLSACLSLPPFPLTLLDWLEWVKQANLFSRGLKLPACLFGCGKAQMISALPSVTTAHVVQIKSKSALFV